MSKRKTLIELQSKPENKAVRSLIEKTKPVNYAPLSRQSAASTSIKESALAETNDETSLAKPPQRDDPQSKSTSAKKSVSAAQNAEKSGFRSRSKSHKSPDDPLSGKINENQAGNLVAAAASSATENAAQAQTASQTQTERLRIFQTSTPITRTVTRFQKAAIVVRGENGKQLIELLWRDQMNEKTRDIWDYLVGRFAQAAESQTNEISIKKRDVLAASGVKSDRTFINAVYTLEDMGLIEVKRLSGNKEGNVYVLTPEGREELESYPKPNV